MNIITSTWNRKNSYICFAYNIKNKDLDLGRLFPILLRICTYVYGFILLGIKIEGFLDQRS